MERQVENVRKIPPKFVWRYEKSVSLCKALNLPNLFMSSFNEAIPGESTGLYTPAEGVRLGAKMFHFNRGGSSTKAELNSMSLVSTPPLP